MTTYTVPKDTTLEISNPPSMFSFIIETGSDAVDLLTANNQAGLLAEQAGYAAFGVNNPLMIGYGYRHYENNTQYTGNTVTTADTLYFRPRTGGITLTITPL